MFCDISQPEKKVTAWVSFVFSDKFASEISIFWVSKEESVKASSGEWSGEWWSPLYVALLFIASGLNVNVIIIMIIRNVSPFFHVFLYNNWKWMEKKTENYHLPTTTAQCTFFILRRYSSLECVVSLINNNGTFNGIRIKKLFHIIMRTSLNFFFLFTPPSIHYLIETFDFCVALHLLHSK